MADIEMLSRIPISNGRSLAGFLKFVGPLLLAIFGAYGTVKYTEGQTQQRIATLEVQQIEQTKVNEKMLTRDEFKQFSEATIRELGLIHDDVRGIRSDLRNK